MAKDAQSRVRAPYEVLCKLLGNPVHNPPSGERVAWDAELDGARVRIAGHTEDKTASGNIFDAPDATWRVASRDSAALERACRHLSQRVIDAVAQQSGGRSLSPEAKVALNEMIKGGVPLGEAMKRVRTQVVDDRARTLYAWPITVAPTPVRAMPPKEREDEAPDDDSDAGMDGFQVVEPDVPPPEPSPKKTQADREWEDQQELDAMDGDAFRATMRERARGQKKAGGLASLMRDLMRANDDLLDEDDPDAPRDTIEAPFARLVTILGEPEAEREDTRWRFVLDLKKPAAKQLVRYEDEPSDDATDVDGTVRSTESDARTARAAKWTVSSSSNENLAKVLAWLKPHLTST